MNFKQPPRFPRKRIQTASSSFEDHDLSREGDSLEESEKHHKKMKRIKKIKDRLYEDADKEKGLLMVHTGSGKGKTTAAMGMVVRCIGHGMSVGIVQYVKGTMDTAEEVVFVENFDELVDFYRMGKGFTWETQDRETDRKAAQDAWEQSQKMLRNDDYDFVLLDELNIVISDGLLKLDEVLQTLQNRPDGQHVVVTGRRAKQDLIQQADMATEMRAIKHHFQDQGVKAQPGIER